MKKSAVVAVLALSMAIINPVSAEIITYAGYEHDTDTNVVNGDGLSWLRWDQTISMTANAAVSAYEAEGWRLANNIEMAGLLNDFNFGMTFTDSENVKQHHESGEIPGENSVYNFFISMFGDTWGASGGFQQGSNPLEYAHAIFGGDEDGDGYLNQIQVRDDWFDPIEGRGNPANVNWELDSVAHEDNFALLRGGVALVRDLNTGKVTVDEPLGAALFAMGFGIFLLSNRKARK